MAGGRVDWLGMTRGRPVAAAVVGRAQVRAALQHCDSLASRENQGARRFQNDISRWAMTAPLNRSNAPTRRLGQIFCHGLMSIVYQKDLDWDFSIGSKP